ncbi:hypothetical protein [Helicobacter burdigaliensis]|uniref:hypothetical protein n=1 Tax=Helicobacter burdigaliensis TaxID=2315334 RepID=UPI000EF6A6C3|nr:hypothetical protein [Helicobacter burdigaliensis]
MANTEALTKLVAKLDEIKEAWQIYEIFEEERKKFNEEFALLEEDKKKLIETFNEISAKNAMLLAQNKDLEEKNKALEQHLNKANQPIYKIVQAEPKDTSFLQNQFENLKQSLHTMQEKQKKFQKPILEPLKKVEILYKNTEKLLAVPAKEYIATGNATLLEAYIEEFEKWLLEFDLEFSKFGIEIRDFNKEEEYE